MNNVITQVFVFFEASSVGPVKTQQFLNDYFQFCKYSNNFVSCITMSCITTNSKFENNNSDPWKKYKTKLKIMLKKDKDIEVLSGLRSIFKFTNLYNKNGVYIKFNKYGDSFKIPDFIWFSLILLPPLYFVLLLIWASIDENFDLRLISTSLAAIFAIIQAIIAYISLAMKTDSIISTFDHLQEVVEKSE